MKRRGLSKVERTIRAHKLREYVSPRVEAERERLKAEQLRNVARETEYQAWQAECQRQQAVREKAEAAAQALHRKLLDDGMREWQRTAPERIARDIVRAAAERLKLGH